MKFFYFAAKAYPTNEAITLPTISINNTQAMIFLPFLLISTTNTNLSYLKNKVNKIK